ncbi:MAG: tetratricopeptide repeat protein, partial [Pseudomonas sp.]|nr:tetratricopeptide repeat protein [Pseudomonas sp.]
AACAGRRGWLFCLPLLLMLPPQSSQAFELDDLWLRPDQQGQRLLEAQRPDEAAQRVVNSQWQGKALYEAEDYSAAAERFAKGDSAADHYNRGNALAKAGELEAALDAYEQALERQPELAAAQHNKALVEEALRQRENQQQSGSGDSDEQQEPANEQPEANESSAGQPAESNTAQPAKPGSTGENSERSETQGSANGAGEDDVQPSNGSETLDDAEPVEKPRTEADLGTAAERRQALEQWLRQIPDDPAELLRRKFWYEQQQRQDSNR